MRSNASFGFEHNGTAGDGHGLRTTVRFQDGRGGRLPDRNSQAAPLFRPFFGSKDGKPKGPTEQ